MAANGSFFTFFMRRDEDGAISTSTVFDYFPYAITAEQMEQPAAEFMDDIKSQCELWRVICELEQLRESAEILYRPF